MNKLDVRVDLFNRFYNNYKLNNLILGDTDFLWLHVNAQIQILDTDGIILMDSIGAIGDGVINTTDVQTALAGKTGMWVGNVDYSDHNVMSVAAPLKNEDGEIIGVLRLVSSLAGANSAILRASFMLLWIGLLVILISAVMSFLIANSIVKPIKELTVVAEKMADGQYKIRSELSSDDELGKLSSTLNTMAEEILKREQIKNDFISSISHELRTPLTSIKGWAVVLKDLGEGEEEILKEGLNIIENESDRLSKMVEELLDFSRYISGRIQLEKDIFNISETCRMVARQMEPRALSNSLDFLVDIQDEKTLIVGDENRIKQLLINLLDNAIKFTSENGWVKFTSYVDENNFVILVSDNGVGIDKSDLIRVKEKFYKGKHSKSHSGIGLSISDEIAKLHNGNIELFSEPNIGTTVKVSIPIVNEEEGNWKEYC